MTEVEWLACTDPKPMLEFHSTSDTLSERKARLFSVACCRQIWLLIEDQRYRETVGEKEARADQLSPPASSLIDADSRPEAVGITLSQLAVRFAMAALLEDRWLNVPAMCARAASEGGIILSRMNPEKIIQCCLLRCIFGNPFRPVSLNPAVLTWNDATVVRLAQTAYDEREMPAGTLDNGRLKVLADALEEAGSTGADILNHLREPGPHVRGCWAVDLLLGKE
jgi:hypothetical protein